MPFDLADHLGAMSRTVKNLERDGKPVKAVIATRIYPTSPADLWNALTTPERIKRWFAPVSGELVLGGRYQVEGNAGGTITRCEPERGFAATWEFAGGMSWIEIALSPEAGGTRLELTHMAPIDPHWDKFGPGAVGVGWDLGLMGLARHIDDPDAERPPEADQSWFATDEYKGMVRSTSDDWGRAAIAAGENAANALAAAERTRRFYTGELSPSEM